MKRKFIFALLFTATFTSVAIGGYTQPALVDVDLVTMFAQGDQLTARVDEDMDVHIGCGVRYLEIGGGDIYTFGFCQAEDADGDDVTCFSENAELLAAINSISDYSFITFSWNDDGEGNLTCTRIGNSTQSFYLPQKLKGNVVE